MRKFAMLGKWHVHAEGYAKELNALPDCRVVKVWDEDERQAQAWAQALGCESATVEGILNDPDIEGVVICNATDRHPDLLMRACMSGKAVFTEKVLTLTEKDALEVKEAVEKNGTRFAISFPHMTNPALRFAVETAREGKLGTLNYARVRKAHDGAIGNWLPPHFYDPVACGGGAMVDLGAHPMYVLCALLGMPERVQSAFTHMTGKPVEDNAVCMLTYTNGAIGVAETGFVSFKYPFTVEIGGTKGTLMLHGDKVEYCCEETDNRWKTADELPAAQPSPLAQWAQAKNADDISAEFGIDAAVRLSRVMEMAYAKKAQ